MDKKKVIGVIVILLMCCLSSSAAIAISMNREDEDPVKTSAGPSVGPSADSDSVSDSVSDSTTAPAKKPPTPPPPPPPPSRCAEGYIKSGKKCTKLTRKSGAEHIKRGTPPQNADFKDDYYYEPGTYYEGGEVFNKNTLFTDFPNSTHSDEYREKECFKKCDDDDNCELVTFAKGTPRDLGNWNVECWGRGKAATRVERTSDGRFTRGDNLMDSDYHNTYHKKSATNMS